ncbi:MAG TPA: molybdopterin-dependent oxidoreductase [Stellaceae bacterium]|nr:molybdopterin-dependent oxidoreductase [Stellaceae bacterium]
MRGSSNRPTGIPHRAGLRRLQRRLFLGGGLSLGALALLSGCNLEDDDAIDRLLFAMSRWNDKAQAALFSPTRLAPVYRADQITDPFPFNAYYDEALVPRIDPTTYRLEVGGLVENREPWILDRLYALPQTSQITRHICIEGWSAIGQWSGVRFSEFLARVGADKRARYVSFRCADGYSTSVDMATALHPQTLLAFRFRDAVLPAKYGFPMKLRVPTKLGFKNPKHVMAINVTNEFPGGFWEKYGYNWFSGL